MDAFPHHYVVTANADAGNSSVAVNSSGLTTLSTDAPAEFGGPGDAWSPETLLMAAVADCFILSFRAIAHASKVQWQSIDCEATGTLDRVERTNKFTQVNLNVSVNVGQETDEEKLLKVLHKAEDSCLITNSMTAGVSLNTNIQRS